MARTTEAEIRKIIEIDSTITDLDPFINIANAVVTAQCSGISTAEGAIVETWLSAHFITIRDMRVDTEKAKTVSAKYQYKIDLGLDCSMYGQMAMQADSTGGLARWNNAIKKGKAGGTASVSWIGKTETEALES